MEKALSEKIYFSLVLIDFDYIATRHLMAGGLFPSAGALANLVIDRYIKTFLSSISRDNLVQDIRNWRGNKSHDILRMLELCRTKLNISPVISDHERDILENIYKCYCFRYVDSMFRTGGQNEIRMNFMHTIDKICAFFREKTIMAPPHIGNTIVDVLVKGDSRAVSALSSGNVNLREVLLADNPYFGR